MSNKIIKWFRNVSIKRKLYFVVGIMALLIAGELCTLWFAVKTLSAVRAYVGGESLWSKAQKDAGYYLQKYGHTHDQNDYNQFRNFLKIPLADAKSRFELGKRNPNFEMARQGFIQGQNHPDDVNGMIWLFRTFNKISYIEKAIIIWGQAEPVMVQLIPIGDKLNKEINSANPSQEKINEILTEIDPINQKLTKLEAEFSFTLGEGSRWLENLILKILLLIAVTVEFTGLFLTASVSIAITKSIDEVVMVSNKIAKGDYSSRAKIYSDDEIGKLANAFNRMVADLGKRIEERNLAEETLIRQKQILEEKTTDLIREKQKLAQAQKLAHVGSWEWNVKDSAFTCSDELYRILGVESDELKITYQEFFDFVYPDDRKHVIEAIQKSMTNLQAFDFFHRIIRRDGSIREIHTRGELLFDENNNMARIVGTEQDITERKKEEELEQLAMVAIKSYNAVTIANKDGKIEWVNEGFTRLFGYRLKDVKGTYGQILRRGENTGLSPDTDFYKIILTEKKPLSYENKNYSKDGEEFWVLTSFTPILDEKGNVEKIISIDSDISKQKRAEKELISANLIAEQSIYSGNMALDELHKAKAQLEESLKVKEQFLANMSHEIRTPMNAIIGFTNLLQKKDLGSESNQYLNAIQTSGENLLVIINDILDFSKLESGKVTFENIRFKLHELINMLVNLMHPKALEKNIKLTSEIDKDIPAILIGDPTRLNQILINLVGNAIKFTNSGEVKIYISTLKKTAKGIELKFSVTDTGIGIPEESLSKIFESFTQAANDTARRFGGTGLGLSITKQLIELQGGKIAVTSKVKQGSKFEFNLNFIQESKTENKNLNVTNDHGNEFPLKNVKILVVEDNSFNQILVEKLLERWQCEVEIADNGIIAIDKIKQHNFDIILMDIQLPEMDGYETTRFIRNEMESPKCNIPIIAMTAHAFADEIQKCVNEGMNDYISKPFNESTLYDKILHAVEVSKV